jgi:hypothetical protein
MYMGRYGASFEEDFVTEEVKLRDMAQEKDIFL